MKNPHRPLSVYLRTGTTVFCKHCGSTKPRTGFLRLFGKRKCDNYECRKRQRTS
jgi:uncharacterized protein (DUF983 family)